MMKIIFLAMVLLLGNTVFAQTYDYCIDNSTLKHIKETEIKIMERNITRTINITENENCSYGCQNNQCLKSPNYNWMLAIGIIVVVLFIMYLGWLIFR